MGALYRVVKPWLFGMDPEDAHLRIASLLRLAQATPGALAVLRSVFSAPEVPARLGPLKLRNPVGLGAGFDKNAEMIPALASLGFGFLEVGTITRRGQPGNPRPRVFRYPALQAVVNRMGFNNVGADEAARTLEKTPRPGIPIGINVGKNATTPLEDAAAEYAETIRILLPFADYVTINISSPNTKDLRKLHEPERLLPLLDAAQGEMAKATRPVPLFLKLSPDADLADLEGAARTLVERNVGIIATNTTVDRTGMDNLEQGGLSGVPVRARSTQVVKALAAITEGKVPLIGVGGVFSAQDALEKRDAGADAVQVYTGLVYGGPGMVRTMVGALAKEGSWLR